MAFTKPGSTDIVESTHPNQIMDALDGTAGQGQPIALTALSDATNPALQVRNQDSTNGKCQEWLDAAGAVMGRVIGTTTGYFEFLKKLTLTLGSFSTAANMFSLTATWTSAAIYKALHVNITNTSSDAASRLLDLQVGGTSVYAIDTAGTVQVGNGIGPFDAVTASNSSGTISSGTTYVDVPNMETAEMTTRGGNLYCFFSATVNPDQNDETLTLGLALETAGSYAAAVDVASFFGSAAPAADTVCGVYEFTSVAAGAHQVKLQYKTTYTGGGAYPTWTFTTRNLFVMEARA